MISELFNSYATTVEELKNVTAGLIAQEEYLFSLKKDIERSILFDEQQLPEGKGNAVVSRLPRNDDERKFLRMHLMQTDECKEVRLDIEAARLAIEILRLRLGLIEKQMLYEMQKFGNGELK